MSEIRTMSEYISRANKYGQDVTKYNNKDMTEYTSLLPISAFAGAIAGTGIGGAISHLPKVSWGGNHTNLRFLTGGWLIGGLVALAGTVTYLIASNKIAEKHLMREKECLEQFKQTHTECFNVDT